MHEYDHIEYLEEELAKAQQQRAELLEALKEVTKWNDSEKRPLPTWLESIVDEAITKAEAVE